MKKMEIMKLDNIHKINYDNTIGISTRFKGVLIKDKRLPGLRNKEKRDFEKK